MRRVSPGIEVRNGPQRLPELSSRGWTYTKYSMVPSGGEDDEKVGVIVEEDGMFRVFEHVRPENSRS